MDSKLKSSRAAFVFLVVLLATSFILIEFPIMNQGRLSLSFRVWQPRLSVLRILFYTLVLAALIVFHKRIEYYFIENQCLKRIKIIYYLIFAVILLGYFFNYLFDLRLNKTHLDSLVLASLIVLLCMWAISILFIGSKTENNFLAVSIPLLSLFPFITKANHGVDETSHFTESYSVMMGHFFNVQYHGVVPEPFLSLDHNIPFYNFIVSFQKHLNYNSVINIDPNAIGVHPAGYPTVFYIPAAIGLWIGKQLNFTVMAEFFSGRLANCLFYILIAYFAIRIMPIGKNIFSVVLLAPYLTLLSSTYSIDGLGTALILLFAALCFYYSYSKKDLKIQDYMILAVLAVIVLLFKSLAYCAVLLFLFLIPLKKLLKKDGLIKAAKIALPILILLAAAVAVLYFLRLPAGYGDTRGGNRIDAAMQFRHILAYPLFTIDTFLDWVRTSMLTPTYIGELISFNFFFGSGDNMLVPGMALWLFVAATDKNTGKIGMGREIKEKILLLGYVLITPVLIAIGLYLIFTNVGAHDISGVQNRYLYPIIPFALLLLNSKRIKNSILNYNSKIAFCASLILAIAQFEMIIAQ